MIALRGGPQPTVLVDIKRIAELGTVRWTPAGDLEIGACVRVQDVAEDTRIREVFTALAEGAEAIGSLQAKGLIRYRRGVVDILDRAGLEAMACECYGAVRRGYERLLPASFE